MYIYDIESMHIWLICNSNKIFIMLELGGLPEHTELHTNAISVLYNNNQTTGLDGYIPTRFYVSVYICAVKPI